MYLCFIYNIYIYICVCINIYFMHLTCKLYYCVTYCVDIKA